MNCFLEMLTLFHTVLAGMVTAAWTLYLPSSSTASQQMRQFPVAYLLEAQYVSTLLLCPVFVGKCCTCPANNCDPMISLLMRFGVDN